MRVSLYLLGHPYAELGGMRTELPTTKPTCLLLYLACRGDWASRDELADLFRPEADEATARHGLRLLLSRARRFGWAQGLEVEPQRLRWTPPSDVTRFREALGRGNWGAATALYGGPLLEGFTVRSTPGFEDFVALERRALESAWREAALRHAHDLEDAQPQEAAALLARVLAQDLLAEDAVQRFMRLSYRTGGREEALRVFADFRDRLEDELGLAPLEETEALAALVRRAERVEVQPSKPATKSVPLAVQHPPRVVGREAVRAALTDRRLPVALLAGEPGVGKTRLLEEVAPGAVWLRCREGLSDVPYFPLLTWLRGEVESLPALAPAYLDELARLAPELAPGRLPPPFDPHLGRSRLLEAFAQLFVTVGVADGGEGALVFDDLQWADAATVELLLYLAERGDLRILGTYRSTETSEVLQKALRGLASNGRLEQHHLAPLTPDDVTDFVASLSGQPQGPPLFSGWLHARTGGNPFFILETLKALFENGLIREQDRHWHTELDELTRDYSELEVPHRVAETVRRRVSALSEPSKRVLGVAAVVREGFAPELLSALTGLSTWAVLDVLEEAGRVGLLRGAAFGHDLVRQSLYESMGAERRKRLHARAAEVLSSTENPTVNPAVVAEHYFLGGDAERAAAFWLTAARALSAQHLPDLAAALLEDKVKLVDAPWLERLQAELAETYMVLGHYEQARGVAQTVLRPSADVQAQAHAYLVESHLAFNEGRLEEMEALLGKAQALGPGQAEPFSKRVAETQVLLLHARGRFQEALEFVKPYLEAHEAGRHAEHLDMVMNAATLFDCLERHEEALTFHKWAWSLVADAGSCYYRVHAATNLLACYIDLERPEAGINVAEATLATCGAYAHIAALNLRNNLAAAYRRTGRLEKALALYQTITQGELTTPVQFVALGSLARLYHQLGDEKAGYDALERALNALPTIHLPAVKGRVYVVTLVVGTDAQKARIRDELALFDLTTLPPDVREELRDLLND